MTVHRNHKTHGDAATAVMQPLTAVELQVPAGQWAAFSQPNRRNGQLSVAGALSDCWVWSVRKLYMEFYFLPHSEHTVSALQSPASPFCVGKRSELIVRVTREQNARILIDKQVVHIVTLMLQRVNMAWYNNPAEPCTSDTDIMWSGAHGVMIMVIRITNEYLMAHLQVNAHLKGSRLGPDVYREQCICCGVLTERQRDAG